MSRPFHFDRISLSVVARARNCAVKFRANFFDAMRVISKLYDRARLIVLKLDDLLKSFSGIFIKTDLIPVRGVWTAEEGFRWKKMLPF